MIRALFFTFIFIVSSTPVWAQAPIQTKAKQAIVMDFETGAVLFEKNSQDTMPTSSMSKVMTMYQIFSAIKKGEMSLSDTLPVSEKAWRKGGSKMFVEVNKRVKVEDLIRGVIVQSGNDATIVLAEGHSGSEGNFADALNETAATLGMKDSHFTNASGWPDPEHYSTANDLAVMAKAIITNFPEHYKYYAEKEFTYNNITQQNRNPLLYKNIGADGLKTGHTDAGGYGLIGTGKQAERRVIIVVNGLNDEKARADESGKLLEWGLQRFKNITLVKAGQSVEEAAIVLGKLKNVTAIVKDDLLVTVPKVGAKDIQVHAKFKEPLLAPVTQGDEIGEIEIKTPYGETISAPLYAAQDVEKLGMFGRAVARTKALISDKL